MARVVYAPEADDDIFGIVEFMEFIVKGIFGRDQCNIGAKLYLGSVPVTMQAI